MFSANGYLRHGDKSRYRYKTYRINNTLDQLFIPPVVRMIEEYYYPAAHIGNSDYGSNYITETIEIREGTTFWRKLHHYFRLSRGAGIPGANIKPSVVKMHDIKNDSYDVEDEHETLVRIYHCNRIITANEKKYAVKYGSWHFEMFKMLMLANSHLVSGSDCELVINSCINWFRHLKSMTSITGVFPDLCYNLLAKFNLVKEYIEEREKKSISDIIM